MRLRRSGNNTNHLLQLAASAALAVAVLLFSALPACAEVYVRAEVSPQSGDTEDIFTFAVVVEGARSAAAPELSGSQNFAVRYVGRRIGGSTGDALGTATYAVQLTTWVAALWRQ